MATILDSIVLGVRGTRLRLPEWAGLGILTGVQGCEVVAVGSGRKSHHRQSGLRSQVELRLGSVSGDIEVSGNTT